MVQIIQSESLKILLGFKYVPSQRSDLIRLGLLYISFPCPCSFLFFSFSVVLFARLLGVVFGVCFLVWIMIALDLSLDWHSWSIHAMPVLLYLCSALRDLLGSFGDSS